MVALSTPGGFRPKSRATLGVIGAWPGSFGLQAAASSVIRNTHATAAILAFMTGSGAEGHCLVRGRQYHRAVTRRSRRGGGQSRSQGRVSSITRRSLAEPRQPQLLPDALSASCRLLPRPAAPRALP